MKELTKSGFRRLQMARAKVTQARLDLLNAKLQPEDASVVEKAWDEFNATLQRATADYVAREPLEAAAPIPAE